MEASNMAFSSGFPALNTLVTMTVLIAYGGTCFPHLCKPVPLLISTLFEKAYTWFALSDVYFCQLLTMLCVI